MANILKGKVSATIVGLTVRQVWPLLANFVGVHRLVPAIETCELAEGVLGEPGCIRLCTAAAGRVLVKERLISIDHNVHKISYEIVGNTIGWGRYDSTMEFFDDVDGGCRMDWSVEMEAVKGWSEERLAAHLGGQIKDIVNNIQELCRAEAQNI